MAGVQMVLSVAEIFVTVGLCFLISSNKKKKVKMFYRIIHPNRRISKYYVEKHSKTWRKFSRNKGTTFKV